MKSRHFGIVVFFLATVLMIAGCDLGAPELVLRVVNPSITTATGSNIRITFQLYNSGSESLQNCKVRWYVDDTPGLTIEYDEITAWAPSIGVDLGAGQTSSTLSVDTSATYPGGVTDADHVGIYEMGWNYSTE